MSATKKMSFLAIAVLIAIFGYNALWQTLADTLKSKMETFILANAANGKPVECSNLDILGYPFRLGLTCSATSFTNEPTISVQAGAFRSAAQIYKPNHIVGELDGPLSVSATNKKIATLNWALLQTSIHLGLKNTSRASLNIEKLDASLIDLGTNNFKFSSEKLALHTRKNENDIDIAGSLSDFKIHQNFEQFNGALAAFNISFLNQADLLNYTQGSKIKLVPANTLVRHFGITMKNGAQIKATGPVKLNSLGEITAALDIDIQGLDKWQELLNIWQKNNQTEAAEQISSALSLITQGQNQKQFKFHLKITDGIIKFGPFAIGKLPTIKLNRG